MQSEKQRRRIDRSTRGRGGHANLSAVRFKKQSVFDLHPV
jgi:hypothetical protein